MLQRILTEYPTAKDLPYKGHALARIIRVDAKRVLEAALGEMGVGLFFKGSPGQSDWVTVPWIAIFDPAITRRTTRGYYVVYLFHASEPIVHLSLNQGTTAVRGEFGNRAREVLRDRANLMRRRVTELASSLPVKSIELGSTAELPGDYVAGHALGAKYLLASLPDEVALRADLQSIIRTYRALTYRGGTDADIETQGDIKEEFSLPTTLTVVETRKYAFHRKIEAMSRARHDPCITDSRGW
jgi:5-methylcytosine-specific restriction protein A